MQNSMVPGGTVPQASGVGVGRGHCHSCGRGSPIPYGQVGFGRCAWCGEAMAQYAMTPPSPPNGDNWQETAKGAARGVSRSVGGYYRPLVLLALLLALGSCASIAKVNAALDKADEALAKVNTEVLPKVVAISGAASEAVAQVRARTAEFDTDKDGRLSWAEILAALATIGSIGAAAYARAKSNVANARIDKAKAEVDELWDKTAAPSK